MRALVFVAPGKVELRDEPEPTPGDGEELITVRASGICGSELHGFRSVGMRVPPLIMGHEFVGTTSSGERVAVNPLLSCGDCDSCADGHPQVCRHRGLLGVSRAGGFAETVAVPRSALHPLPDELTWSAGSLIEPLANAVHAWSLMPTPPARVGVMGAGPIGLLCGLVARTRGSDVQIAELLPERRALAADLGLDAVASLRPENDVVFDAVGLPGTRRASVELTRPAGAAVWLGLAEDAVELPGNSVVRAEKKVYGSFAYTPAEFAEAVQLATRLDLSWTTEVPLDEAATAFNELAAGRSKAVKAVLVPGVA